jgi:hypothetical protein
MPDLPDQELSDPSSTQAATPDVPMNAPLRSTLTRLVPALAIVALLAWIVIRPSPVAPAAIVAPPEAPAVIEPAGDPIPAPVGPGCDPPKSTLACTWTYNDAAGKVGSLSLTLDYQPPTTPAPCPMTWRSKPFTLPADYCGVKYLGSPETAPLGATCTVTFERLGPEKFNHSISVGTAYPTLPYIVYRIGPDRAECSPLLVALKSSTGNGREAHPKGYDAFQVTEPGHGVD